MAALSLALFDSTLAAFSPQLDPQKRGATIKRLLGGLGRRNNNVRVGRWVYSLAPFMPIDNPPLIFTIATFERDRELAREWKRLQEKP